MRFLSTILIVLLFANCTPDKENYGPQSDRDVQIDAGAANWVYVLNEGNYTWGNASLTAYDLNAKHITQGAFQAVNNRPLGDVAQSMFVRNDTAWIVVNNSGKVELIKLPSLAHIQTISGFESPRYIHCYGNRCYVTDLYKNSIQVTSLNGDFLHEIPLKAQTERVKAVEDYVYVEQIVDSLSTIYQLNAKTGAILQVIAQEVVAIDFREDYCYWINNGKLHQLDYEHSKIEVMESNIPANAHNLQINQRQDLAYYRLNNSIVKQAFSKNSKPDTLLHGADLNVYNLHYSSASEQLFVVDVKDYIKAGEVIVLNQHGVEESRISAGIIPYFISVVQL